MDPALVLEHLLLHVLYAHLVRDKIDVSKGGSGAATMGKGSVSDSDNDGDRDSDRESE